ncbi:polysaccharide pyruvyl transferase family protein [Cellulomonas rhizosphaerae]|uniref:Polysaccharide pyruvyl transferase family protein n=1 Tax=Cellulomonas rhizosphaerae TaxID=2293719 RepID=A0A413RJS8_9CELL|nr:polysaccharide pyruvyl transferase family protein [Cellulomonas rhizosphaerae]RHA38888.1 polysaccharide pyruvyl transferase family protein [Cellulomonas rhizosphaerae]
MPRFLIRAGKDPRTALSHEQSLATSTLGVFGSNSGNMLFYSGVHRVLSVPGTEIVANSYVHERPSVSKSDVNRVNDEFDRFILPMANSYRDTFLPHLERLAGVIESLTVPVNVIGIGAQLPYGTAFDTLPDEYKRVVKRFTAAVLDRSESIGVRGQYTAEMLEHLGFSSDRIDVIGCPSMFGRGQLGPLRRKVERLESDSAIAISYTPKVAGVAELVNANASRYRRSVIIPQQHQRLALMLWGEDPAKVADPTMPIHTGHRLYREDRMRFFVDASTWVDFMAEQDFAFGTRIHGNVAGVLAGTPSVVLAHDSRTVELSQYHGIPYRLYSDLPADVDAQRLYDEADFDAFEGRQPETFATYQRFLERNGLEHIFQDGKANRAYDKAIDRAPFPGPVHTLMADGETGREQVMGRLRWLRQGANGDFERSAYEFDRPFVGPRQAATTAQLAKQVLGLQSDIARLQRQVRAKAPAAAPTKPSIVRRVRRRLRGLR